MSRLKLSVRGGSTRPTAWLSASVSRGMAGTAGTVLIDGAGPSTKSDSLDQILRRIPAAGVDMQGRSVVANVILRPFLASAGSRSHATGRVWKITAGPRDTVPLALREVRRTKMSPWLFVQIRETF